MRIDLDRAVAQRYRVDIEDQQAFSARALKKFRDRTIKDTIQKNARAALRKLGGEERLIGPLALLNEYGGDTAALLTVIASALVYLKNEEKMEYNGITYSNPCLLLRAMHGENVLSNQDYEKIQEIYTSF